MSDARAVTTPAPYNMLDHALDALSRGFSIFPVFGITNGACDCSDPKCSSPGKHPAGVLVPHGVDDASCDETQVRSWWQQYPDANIGIRTGDGVLVVDVDPRNGGNATIEHLESEHRAFPETATVLTGGGGLHAFYRVTRTGKWKRKLGDGVDIKADGGYIVAAGSRHVSGGVYRWADASAIVDAPVWLVELAAKASDATSSSATATTSVMMSPEPITYDLGALRARLSQVRRSKASGDETKKRQAQILGRVLDGDALASVGERDEVLLVACGLLAYWLPHNTPWEVVLELLRPSLAAMDTNAEGFPHWIEEARKKYERQAVSREAKDAKTAEERARILDVARAIAERGRTSTNASEAAVSPNGSEPEPQPLKSGSFASLIDVLRGGGVLDGELEFDLMAGAPTLGRRPLRDEDVDAIRLRIQKTIIVERTKSGDAIGLRFSASEVARALALLAREREFHPVREYLSELAWDGVSRIERVASEVLRADDTPLNRELLRRWFISAVARPMVPGCKVDTVLVLVGAQGAFKSSFFRALASPYFVDSAIAVGSKDALATLRRAWVLEFAELEAVRRARDAEAVKAFLASSEDTYRPAYGHFDVQVKRTGVIVGSTNRPQFLDDESGNRRYWPITVGRIDVEKLATWRDQLWAEATAAFQAGERWWLDAEHVELLEAVHADHEVEDSWGARVIAWCCDPCAFGTVAGRPAARRIEITTAAILEHALGLLPGVSKKTDEMRIGAIMRRAGWLKTRPDKSKPHVWRLSTEATSPAHLVLV